MTDIKLLITDLNSARSLADAKVTNVSDGGTCNHDRLAIYFKRAPPEKKRRAILAALKAENYSAYWSTWLGKMAIFLDPDGQGRRRTLWAKTMADTLRGLNWDTTVFYQMD
jgi:hypothetical protein